MYKQLAAKFHQVIHKTKSLSFAKLAAQAKALAHADASPAQLAQGFALGTFISILPTPGLNILLATALLGMFKELNRMALFAALTFWNTLVVAPLYALSSKLGALIFTARVLQEVGALPGSFLSPKVAHFVVGNVTLALVITAVSYLLVQTAVSLHQQRKLTCKVAPLS